MDPRSLLRLWGWGWLAITHLVLDLVLSFPFLLVVGLLLGGIFTLPAFFAGLPLLVVALLAAMLIAAVERERGLAHGGKGFLAHVGRDRLAGTGSVRTTVGGAGGPSWSRG